MGIFQYGKLKCGCSIGIGNAYINNEFNHPSEYAGGELSDTSKQLLGIADRLGVKQDSNGTVQILDILEALTDIVTEE